MTEDDRKTDPTLERVTRRRDTVEAYRTLLETEVKNILERMGTLAKTQDQLLVTVNDLSINIEEVLGTMERLETSREFFREEIAALKETTSKNEAYSKALLKKMKLLQNRLQALEDARED